jgi:two-component system NtrC family sensor kinase
MNLTFYNNRHLHEKGVGEVDVNAALDESLALILSQLATGGIRLEREFHPGLPPIRGNKSLLQHVFLNMILNACNAMTKGGTLTVSTVVDDEGKVGVVFRDSGCGITKENLSKIFDPFFTAMPKSNSKGLGLFVSRRVVEQHGGMIEVESIVGEGSTFTVLLPCKDI